MKLEDLTPPSMRCGIGTCPAVLELQDGRLLIIGAEPDATLSSQIAPRVGPCEQAILISPKLLASWCSRSSERASAAGNSSDESDGVDWGPRRRRLGKRRGARLGLLLAYFFAFPLHAKPSRRSSLSILESFLNTWKQGSLWCRLTV